MEVPGALAPFYEGWKSHNGRLINLLSDLTDEQVKLRPAPHQMAVWQLVSHLAGARGYWFGFLGEGQEIRDYFRVEHSTTPDLPLEDAGWEDDEDHPRTVAELTGALRRTWAMIEECLNRWSAEELLAEDFTRGPTGTFKFSRAWVIWRLMEHDIHHSGEVSNILGSAGIPTRLNI
ncbi:MAG: DinB family protein [Dehalococcoidia bacterium]